MAGYHCWILDTARNCFHEQFCLTNYFGWQLARATVWLLHDSYYRSSEEEFSIGAARALHLCLDLGLTTYEIADETILPDSGLFSCLLLIAVAGLPQLYSDSPVVLTPFFGFENELPEMSSYH